MGGNVSGAKGTESFSESILRRRLPSPSSIQHEGIFYEYYFETANEQEKLFKANFNYAISKDPFNHQQEYYISFGMSGRMDGAGYYKHGGRPPLNLVIVLDISGSMGSSFREETQSKLDVAKESVLTLLDHLSENDAFSLICFDTQAYVTHPPQLWKDTDQTALKTKIMEIHDKGGTSLTAGIQSATDMIKEMQAKYSSRPNPAYSYVENRIMFLTDMCPTDKDKDGSFLFQLTQQNSTQGKIYTTFVGIGLDFNTTIVNKIGKIRGCNYLSVKSAKDFKKMMGEDFDYLVTPNVFNVNIEIDQESQKDWKPIRVYGSPGHEIPENGRLSFIDSSFPSQKESDTSTKGGVVVVKLAKLTSSPTSRINFRITYEDYYGTVFMDTDSLVINSAEEDYYQNESIRKAILLVRYVNFFKNFLTDMMDKKPTPSVNEVDGIVIPTDPQQESSAAMEPLTPEYDAIFNKFAEYFNKEMSAVEDPTLEKELQSLQAVRPVEEQKQEATTS